MNLNQFHTIIRTIVLVDIPAFMFLIACAWIGWPIAITMHWLFFWFGFIAFATILAIGIAKLESKTLIPIGRDRELFRIEVEQQRQKLLPPYPDSEDDQNMVSTHRLVAPVHKLTPPSDILSDTVSATPAYIENVGDMCKKYPVIAARIVNEHLTKKQVMDEYNLSDSTVVRIRRELREYGLLPQEGQV